MLSPLRNNIFKLLLWGFMGMYMLNISVDIQDENPDFVAENLALNDQESIAEILIETVLDFGDVIKEYDDPDSQDYNKRSNAKPQLCNQRPLELFRLTSFSAIKTLSHYKTQAFLSIGFNQLDTPPPKI